ncbi:coiled-coil domain-containing protein 116 isoform X2 [Tamandua tetradactyla]|uniref:coiled-coil domain-containing protein 116 isoform X2 n=1 Tax=Tamandua tetradactyla TaxID=48850 RepID=UPI004053ED3B
MARCRHHSGYLADDEAGHTTHLAWVQLPKKPLLPKMGPVSRPGYTPHPPSLGGPGSTSALRSHRHHQPRGPQPFGSFLDFLTEGQVLDSLQTVVEEATERVAAMKTESGLPLVEVQDPLEKPIGRRARVRPSLSTVHRHRVQPSLCTRHPNNYPSCSSSASDSNSNFSAGGGLGPCGRDSDPSACGFGTLPPMKNRLLLEKNLKRLLKLEKKGPTSLPLSSRQTLSCLTARPLGAMAWKRPTSHSQPRPPAPRWPRKEAPRPKDGASSRKGTPLCLAPRFPRKKQLPSISSKSTTSHLSNPWYEELVDYLIEQAISLLIYKYKFEKNLSRQLGFISFPVTEALMDLFLGFKKVKGSQISLSSQIDWTCLLRKLEEAEWARQSSRHHTSQHSTEPPSTLPEPTTETDQDEATETNITVDPESPDKQLLAFQEPTSGGEKEDNYYNEEHGSPVDPKLSLTLNTSLGSIPHESTEGVDVQDNETSDNLEGRYSSESEGRSQSLPKNMVEAIAKGSTDVGHGDPP